MTDELKGYEPEENSIFSNGVKFMAIIMLVAVLLFTFFMIFTAGCITAAKQIISPTPVPTPKPTPTLPPTPTPTPTPEPTPDYSSCPNCYHLKDWHFWFRSNVSPAIDMKLGSQDMRTWVTVYDYRLLTAYHISAASTWGTTARFRQSPDPGYQFLFIFINEYSDGDDVRSYIFGKNNFAIQVKDKLYYPEDDIDPTQRITEFDDMWDYAHVQTPKQFGYKIIQDLDTGIYRAESKEILYGGRSNAEDGYLIFQIPADANISEIKVAASFANLGGYQWWQLN